MKEWAAGRPLGEGYPGQNDVSVDSGEIHAMIGPGLLRASAIGSCVVIAAFDPPSSVGGMAHVMLPGASQDTDPSRRTRYAADAIEELLKQMVDLGARLGSIQASLVGGGNVLGKDHVSPGPEIVQSLLGLLAARGLNPVAVDVGGDQRRSCTLDVGHGHVTYTVGDSGQLTLWKTGAQPGGFDHQRPEETLAKTRSAP